MMADALKIGIIGDFNPRSATHAATGAALEHRASKRSVPLSAQWIATGAVETAGVWLLDNLDGILIAPGSPYRSMAGALEAIRHARTRGVPLLATCGGFQHVVIEYARNVLGISDAGHAEYDPSAPNLFIVPLACSLAGKSMPVRIREDSRTFGFYRTAQATEPFLCNFGLDPRHQGRLHDAGLRVAGEDENGEARIMEIAGRAFFIATLFVPQLRSSAESPHPLIEGFVSAARSFHETKARGYRRIRRQPSSF